MISRRDYPIIIPGNTTRRNNPVKCRARCVYYTIFYFV